MWLKGFQFHFTARSLQKTPINLQIPFADETVSSQCLASGSAQPLFPKQSLTAINALYPGHVREGAPLSLSRRRFSSRGTSPVWGQSGGQGWQCWERVIIYPAAHLHSCHARCCSHFAYSIVEAGSWGGIGKRGEPWPRLGALGCSVLPAAVGARGCRDIHIWSRFVDNGAPAPGCTRMSCDNLTACPGIPTEPLLSKAIGTG